MPSIQEGMESLAQTLRTRSRSMTKEEHQRQASVQRFQPGSVTHGGAQGAGGAAASGGGAAGAAGGASVTTGGQNGGGRISTGGSASQPLSVDRAQLDLELPYDLETRDLLQILAPAKRTARWGLHMRLCHLATVYG